MFIVVISIWAMIMKLCDNLMNILPVHFKVIFLIFDFILLNLFKLLIYWHLFKKKYTSSCYYIMRKAGKQKTDITIIIAQVFSQRLLTKYFWFHIYDRERKNVLFLETRPRSLLIFFAYMMKIINFVIYYQFKLLKWFYGVCA